MQKYANAAIDPWSLESVGSHILKGSHAEDRQSLFHPTMLQNAIAANLRPPAPDSYNHKGNQEPWVSPTKFHNHRWMVAVPKLSKLTTPTSNIKEPLRQRLTMALMTPMPRTNLGCQWRCCVLIQRENSRKHMRWSWRARWAIAIQHSLCPFIHTLNVF